MKEILSGIKTGLFFAGAVIGAGFATGREVALYFAGFGKTAYFVLPFLFLAFYFGMKVFLNAAERSIKGIWGKIFNILTYITNIILLAGLCSAANQITDTYYFGAVILLFGFLLNRSGFNGAYLCNAIITPLIAVFIVIIYIGGFGLTSAEIGLGSSNFAMLSAINYVSFNLWTCGRTITDSNLSKKGKRSAAITASLLITLLLGIMITSLLKGGIKLINSEMPGEILAESMGLSAVFYIVVLCSIFTSVISFQHCLEKSTGFKLPVQIVSYILCLITSYFGFGNIIKYFYPLFGMVGLAFIIFLLFSEENNKSVISVNSRNFSDIFNNI